MKPSPDGFAAAPPVAATAAPALVTLRGATVRFGHVDALRGVDLTLHRGERLALIGANGSGKTTLLRTLNGLVPLAAGTREVVPLHPEGRPPRIAMLFQRPFLIELSVRRNLLIALWLAGVPRADRARRCSRALERAGLAPLADRAARTLSGGQQQRLALARAWARQPDILLLDEPTASLDPGAKREVESLIDDFGRDGTTVVMSTHNLGQAKRLATRVAYLEGGHLVAQAPAHDFFYGPLPPAAAAFLRGENPWLTN